MSGAADLGSADFQPLLPDLIPLALLSTGWLVLGYLLLNWMERRVRQKGALGQH